MTKCGGFEPPDPYRISGLAIRCNRPLCQHSIFKLLTGFEPADTRSVVVCLILWTTGASYRMRDSNPRFRREKAMTYPACRIRHSRQGEIRTLNVYHMGHGFTDRLLQPFAYLPRKWNGQKSNLRRLDLRPNALPTELPFHVKL